MSAGSEALAPWKPASWPITLKVPLLVALLMFVVSAVLTNRVLQRLEATQEQHLKELANAYLDGLSALVSPHVLRNDTWEVFDALERAAMGYRGLDLKWTTVAGPDGRIIASSQPVAFPADTPVISTITARFGDSQSFVFAEEEGRAHLRRLLTYQSRIIGAIYADVGITALLLERQDVLTTLLVTNGLLTLLFALLGYWLVRRMVHPIKILSVHLKRASRGDVEPIPKRRMLPQSSEFGILFERYNEMAHAVREREMLSVRLAAEEKLASLGRLTSGIAHEINNPLGGLFNAIDALKQHGDKEQVRVTSISLIERGLTGIRDVVRAALHVYRAEAGTRDLKAVDIEDLATLVRPEVKRKRLLMDWDCALAGALPVPAVPVRDLALNLLLNACAATPELGRVGLAVRVQGATFLIEVSDQGCGLAEPMKGYLERAGAGKAPIEDRSGLGLWMVRRLADELRADITVAKGAGGGTTIRVSIPLEDQKEQRDVA